MNGATLRQWRESRGMTQQQLADLLRVRRASIADWERETKGRKILDSALLDWALKGIEREPPGE